MFCENCGRPLRDGEICTCTQQNPTPAAPEQPVSVQPAPLVPEQPVYSQPAPAAPEQPVYSQPAPVAPEQPVYSQPAPAVPEQPVSVQPAPVVPEQPVYSQPAPGQPVYSQPAPGQPVYSQPIYTQPYPAPTAPKYFPYGGPGTFNYNRFANILGSPLLLVYGILSGITLLFSGIISFVLNSASPVTMFFSLLGLMVATLPIIAALTTYCSARSNLKTGNPITTAGLTIASGYSIAIAVIMCICAALLFVTLIIAFAYEMLTSAMIILLSIFIVTFFGIVPYFLLSSSFRGIRYMIAGTGAPRNVSLYPIVIKIINTAFSVIALICYMMVSLAYGKDLTRFIRSVLRDYSRVFGRSYVDFTYDIFEGLFSGAGFVFILLSMIIGIVTEIVFIVLLIKARNTQQDIYSHQNY
ncbi:MAG: hypothetical protein K6F93_00280 [Lachnospiraceae bacterium]|nr:hypothetical protein [Lachnospiraceae bacterium]